jgi:imidazolonepropionase-like amidohydrolase
MRQRCRFLPDGRIGAALVWACIACSDPVSDRTPAPVVLTGLTVIDVAGGPSLGDRTVVIENGVITAIGADGALPLPDGAEVHDLRGRWAVPGFIDVHAHMPAVEHQPAVLRTLLAFGITTARSPAAVPESGVELRARLERGDVLGPRFRTADRLIDAPGSPWAFAVEVTSEAEIRVEVARQAAAGADFVKLYSQLAPDLIGAAVNEAHARGLRVIGHVGRATWGEAIDRGIDALAHSFVHGFAHSAVPVEDSARFTEFFQPNPAFDPALFADWRATIDFSAPRFRQLSEQLAQRRVALDPNLVLAEAIAWGDDAATFARLETQLDPIPHAFPHPYSAAWTTAQRQAARAAFPKFLEAIRIFHERGVLLTAGTDLQNPWMTPGVSFHRELELLVQAGIPAADVLRIASRNGAESLGVLDETGTIEIGKAADLVILDADPLADIANTRAIRLVVMRGRILRPADLLSR